MKKLLVSIFAALLVLPTIFAQPAKDYTDSKDSDPAATAILKKVKATYESYSSVEADFSLQIEFPEEPVEIMKGKLFQKGDKYRIDMETQSIICDGTTVWLFLANNKEVQINNADFGEDSGILSPADLLRAYESGEYVYVLSNESMEDGVAVQQIEFKPLDRDSEYSKMRLTVEKSTAKIKRIKAFSRDGSRFTLSIDKLTPNKALADNKFVWNKSECPDCYVEDLRID
ncbi:MAG: outer membrane lipoprotein carrier protein LolA [Saprospiraceae bacterium]|nr:outer membrane lipoprotein carrier protein LolA [Saprospiraceae bacterium]